MIKHAKRDLHPFRNRAEVLRSTVCHCFHCKRAFVAAQIRQWRDEGETAVCPHCEVDAVIGDASGYDMTPPLLEAMHDHWFVRQILPEDFDFDILGRPFFFW